MKPAQRQNQTLQTMYTLLAEATPLLLYLRVTQEKENSCRLVPCSTPFRQDCVWLGMDYTESCGDVSSLWYGPLFVLQSQSRLFELPSFSCPEQFVRVFICVFVSKQLQYSNLCSSQSRRRNLVPYMIRDRAKMSFKSSKQQQPHFHSYCINLSQ